ncbi:MAG TPA: hypothetical protein VL053_03105 [Arachidicoccus sp.]|nr:hypothetical protein [Arachidicoccus sp.]
MEKFNVKAVCAGFFMTCIIFSACAKSGSDLPGKQNKDDPGQVPDSLKQGYMPVINGTVLTYTVTSGEEAGASATVTIQNVHDSSGFKCEGVLRNAAGILIAESARYNKGFTYTISSLPSLYYDALKEIAKGYNVSFTHTERPIVMALPHKDPLHAVVFNELISSEWHGVNNEEGTTTDARAGQTEHKAVVDSLGKIKLAIGEFDCIRVHFLRTKQSNVVVTDDEGVHNFNSTVSFDLISWMAKGIGPVKEQEINLNTGETTITELTKIEIPH